MGRYVSIFLLLIFISVALFFNLPLLFGEIFSQFIIGIIIIIFGSFIIAQLFYIIDLIKQKNRYATMHSKNAFVAPLG
ncbi:hypothetical protein FB550_115119 [Neobacillus bataviensis]|uniref:Uncharacterized protein n=1 Tax=Neobacillus bataviensis TaxID=220685 RepID=A0A561CRM5_9BACI|nr:hypothetical protein [Neobacillus bataviensis]TWD93478.1 hypothetical protein FB550_115119 [Neobacillus bataviensis]